MTEMSDLRVVVPKQLKAQLRSVLALKGMTLTDWVISVAQRTVDEHKAMRGERE